MTGTETAKQERMHIHLDTHSKLELERAAVYAHTSLSEFVRGQAPHATEEVIHEHESIMLDEVDWEMFLYALDDRPRPNSKLRKAFAEHKKRVKRQEINRLELLITPLGKRHDRKNFDCGEASLDLYLHRYAKQDIRHRVKPGCDDSLYRSDCRNRLPAAPARWCFRRLARRHPADPMNRTSQRAEATALPVTVETARPTAAKESLL